MAFLLPTSWKSSTIEPSKPTEAEIAQDAMSSPVVFEAVIAQDAMLSPAATDDTLSITQANDDDEWDTMSADAEEFKATAEHEAKVADASKRYSDPMAVAELIERKDAIISYFLTQYNRQSDKIEHMRQETINQTQEAINQFVHLNQQINQQIDKVEYLRQKGMNQVIDFNKQIESFNKQADDFDTELEYFDEQMRLYDCVLRNLKKKHRRCEFFHEASEAISLSVLMIKMVFGIEHLTDQQVFTEFATPNFVYAVHSKLEILEKRLGIAAPTAEESTQAVFLQIRAKHILNQLTSFNEAANLALTKDISGAIKVTCEEFIQSLHVKIQESIEQARVKKSIKKARAKKSVDPQARLKKSFGSAATELTRMAKTMGENLRRSAAAIALTPAALKDLSHEMTECFNEGLNIAGGFDKDSRKANTSGGNRSLVPGGSFGGESSGSSNSFDPRVTPPANYFSRSGSNDHPKDVLPRSLVSGGSSYGKSSGPSNPFDPRVPPSANYFSRSGSNDHPKDVLPRSLVSGGSSYGKSSGPPNSLNHCVTSNAYFSHSGSNDKDVRVPFMKHYTGEGSVSSSMDGLDGSADELRNKRK